MDYKIKYKLDGREVILNFRIIQLQNGEYFMSVKDSEDFIAVHMYERDTTCNYIAIGKVEIDSLQYLSDCTNVAKMIPDHAVQKFATLRKQGWTWEPKYRSQTDFDYPHEF